MRPAQVHPASIYTPKLARVVQAEHLTPNERLLRLHFEDGSPLGHRPGQFVEISVFGVGEAPLTVASPARDESWFEICVRRVGNVTRALHRVQPGTVVGVRGPLGRGFPLEEMVGQDILIVAGGIGLIPLRPVIWHILDRRTDFGRLTVLYGVKHPDERLFLPELAEWEARRDVDFRITVDRPVEGWEGHVGVVTTFFPELDILSQNTVALIVGPPVMYKFVLLGLSHKGIPDHKIFLSFERRMKCGVGKCGHCQVNGIYICKDGPTLSYAEIKDLREAIG